MEIESIKLNPNIHYSINKLVLQLIILQAEGKTHLMIIKEVMLYPTTNLDNGLIDIENG